VTNKGISNLIFKKMLPLKFLFKKNPSICQLVFIPYRNSIVDLYHVIEKSCIYIELFYI